MARGYARPCRSSRTNRRAIILWQTVGDGEFVDVAFAGRVAGDEITGTAKIGTYPERQLYARRTEH